MGMDNAARMERVRNLVADISSCQLDAISHQENFKNESNLAYGALQDYLKSKNMKTTDELVKDLIKDLPPAEQQKILDRLKELTPPSGVEYFLQPSELAKFFFWGYLVGGGVKVVTPYYYQAKAWFIATRSKTVLQATMAGQALTEEGKALAKLTQAERQALLDGLEQERLAMVENLEKTYNIEFKGSLTSLEAWESTAKAEEALKDIEKAVEAVQNIEAQEAKAIAAAGKITVWTKVIIVVSIVAIVGLAIYDKVKEKEIQDELHETIAKVCTARLYVRMNERMELTHTDQMSTIGLLAAAFNENDEGAQKFLKKKFADTISKALKNINEDNTYTLLAQQDKDRSYDTSEDPSLDDMKKRKAKDATENKLPK